MWNSWSDTSGSGGVGGLWLQLQLVPGSRLAVASIAAKKFLPGRDSTMKVKYYGVHKCQGWTLTVVTLQILDLW